MEYLLFLSRDQAVYMLVRKGHAYVRVSSEATFLQKTIGPKYELFLTLIELTCDTLEKFREKENE